MPDSKPKNDQKNELSAQQIPLAAITWGVITVFLFLAGLQTITLQDRERFPDDFELEMVSVEAENTVQANVVDGTFRYNVVPQETSPVTTGTFTREDNAPVARNIFNSLEDVTQVTIEAQTMRIQYESDLEADLVLRRLQRPVTNIVENETETITSQVAEDAENTIVFTTSDDEWIYGRYVPALLPEGQQEVYDSRDAGLSGSELASFLFENVTAMEALTINRGNLVITYREGAVERQVVNRVQDALNAFYPRATLNANLWLLSAGFDSSSLVGITPISTPIPLYLFALGFTLLESGLFYLQYQRPNADEDKLVRPIVRVIGIFLLFWSIYGHEPLWDYFLSFLFPTSRQLVHPNATVIEFVAQHLELVIVSSLIIIPVGLFFGVIVTRAQFRELLPLVNNIVNSGQTVPTIAVVAFMAPIIGFGFLPAIIALVVYGLLPVVRNTIAGLESVSDFIIDSARGMGMTPSQILWQIELPIASSIIIAGIRTSMVINVGTATLGAFVGSGGLGTPIASGLAMTVDAFIVLGAIPAAILAILIDYILGRIEYVLTPRGLLIEG